MLRSLKDSEQGHVSLVLSMFTHKKPSVKLFFKEWLLLLFYVKLYDDLLISFMSKFYILDSEIVIFIVGFYFVLYFTLF